MVCLLALALSSQGGSLSKILPPPTGQNGYEEYVRAAELVQAGDARSYRTWIDRLVSGQPDSELQPPPGVDPTDHDIDIRRKWNDRFRPCLELLAKGNRLPVYDPRDGIGPETLYPELVHFKTLEMLEANAARISFADGASGTGVEQLEEGFTFANKLGAKSILVTRLVGIACSSMAFTELDSHWPQLSLDDAKELKRFFGEKLGPPETLIQALTMEKQLERQGLEMIRDNSQALLGDDADVLADLKKLSPIDRENTISDAIAKVNGFYDQLIQTLNGPESKWLDFQDLPEAAPSSPLKERIVAMVMPTVTQAIQAEMKDRIRFRLGYLNACAVEFRWVNGRLPKRIDEFTSKEERVDPISGLDYRYRPEGRWYRIIREGKDALGSQEVRNPPKPVAADSNGGP